MATFTLDNETLANLCSAINVGIDGIENEERGQKIAAVLAELEACWSRGSSIELTIVSDHGSDDDTRQGVITDEIDLEIEGRRA